MTIWERLFGTPERAARTLEEADLDSDTCCDMLDAIGDRPTIDTIGNRPTTAEKCANCFYYIDNYDVCQRSGHTALEWLSHEFVEPKSHDERITVTRCKDCKWLTNARDGTYVCVYRPSTAHVVWLDDFCSRAEPREDE